MSLSDPLADMLTRIRNACQRKKTSVSVLPSSLHLRVLAVLKEEGYIRDFTHVAAQGTARSFIEVALKYFDGSPVVREVSRVSRGGRRVYVSARSIPSVANGLGICVLSTSRGVMADHQAREMNVGGEVLCRVF